MNLLEFYCINLDTSMATQFDGCMGSPPSTRREQTAVIVNDHRANQ
jgi:hypothetical protein